MTLAAIEARNLILTTGKDIVIWPMNEHCKMMACYLEKENTIKYTILEQDKYGFNSLPREIRQNVLLLMLEAENSEFSKNVKKKENVEIKQ